MNCPFIVEALSRSLIVNDDSGGVGVTKRLIALVKTQFRRLGESTTISSIVVPKITSVGIIEWLDEKTILVPFVVQDPHFDFSNNDVVFISDSGAAILGKLNL